MFASIAFNCSRYKPSFDPWVCGLSAALTYNWTSSADHPGPFVLPHNSTHIKEKIIEQQFKSCPSFLESKYHKFSTAYHHHNMTPYAYCIAILLVMLAAVFAYDQGYADPLIEKFGYVSYHITFCFFISIIVLTDSVSISSRPRLKPRRKSSKLRASTRVKIFLRVSWRHRKYPQTVTTPANSSRSA